MKPLSLREWQYLLCGTLLWAGLILMAVAVLTGCSAPVKPVVQYQTVTVPTYIRSPIPPEYTVDRIVVEPKPACGQLYCNGQVAMLIDSYRAALRQSNLDKAALRQLQPEK